MRDIQKQSIHASRAKNADTDVEWYGNGDVMGFPTIPPT